MLRPTRRPSPFVVGPLALLLLVGMVAPAAVGAGAGPRAGGSPTADARADREPQIGARGTRPTVAGRGASLVQLEDLGVDRSNRGAAGQAPDGGGRQPLGAAAPGPIDATFSGAPAATSLGFEGISQATSGFEPADPFVAVGPNDVVQTTNKLVRFRNREGGVTAQDVQLYDFFGLADFSVNGTPVSIDGVADPRWHYDPVRARWLGLTMAWDCGASASDGYLFLAISTTGDPTGDYYHVYVKYPGFLPDYPALGNSSDKITLSANEYLLELGSGCTSGITYDAASLTTFDWANLLGYPLSPPFHYWLDFQDGGTTLFSLRPGFAAQATSPGIFIVGEQPTGPTTSNVAYLRLTGSVVADTIDVTGPVDLTAAGILGPFVEPPTPVDPGGPVESGGFSAVDRRPTDAIWQDGVLTFPSTYPCDPPTGGVEERACARVSQISTAAIPPTAVQDFLVSSAGRDTWYPGVGQSQTGNLHVVYTGSSSTLGMTSYHKYQLTGDALNSVSGTATLANGGTSNYAGGRWGDYVGVAQDPKDTNAVWQGNQYARSDGTWGTRVTELQTAGAVFVPIEPVRLLDSRVDNGTTGQFVSNVAKTVDIAGRGGIPANAVAVTGNLTVVNQTAAGFAAITPIATNNPSTSSLNFPLGDIRANNVTTPLGGPGGGVGIVYKAVANRAAHFIFDVTGYFLDGDAGQTYNVVTPTRVLDSRVAQGLGGPLTANVNYSFQVAGASGVPADAKAVTGNLTVTGQTRAGYVSLSSAPPPPTPATSTLNFPLNDNRANGITVKLSATGRLHVVYKAVSPASTHLIFDVTGYYKDDLTGLRFVPLVPGRRMDTRFGAPAEGLTGPFVANSARTLVVSPYQGVATNARAITGNLTVVNQTRAGFLAITPTATNTPPTSSLNFPFGDIRANGVTGPLSFPAGSIGIVYETSNNTGSTHVILDLTGYFR